MNEPKPRPAPSIILPTAERCREIILSRTNPVLLSKDNHGLMHFSDRDRNSIKDIAFQNGWDCNGMNDGELAELVLTQFYGDPSPLPERDEATGTGPATADRPADIWRDNQATLTQRDGKPEPKLELTPEERWAKQMDRSEALIAKQERLQEREEKILERTEKALSVARPEPKITNTYTDTKTYTDPKPWPSEGGYTKDQEIRELRYLVDEQKAIIANLEKRLEAGIKRGQMVRDLLRREL